MADPPTQNTGRLGLFDEDIVLPSTGYTTGGYLLTVAKANQISRVRFAAVKGSSTSGGMALVAPVVGSETGQQFLLKVYITSGAASSLYSEASAGLLAVSNQTVTVHYEGT